MKALDELITYIENDLIGEHKDIEIIDEAIKKYAELYHKKQLELYGVIVPKGTLSCNCPICSKEMTSQLVKHHHSKECNEHYTTT